MASASRKDPSRTTLIRRRFVADMKRRFKKLSRAIEKLIVTDDVFVATERKTLQLLLEKRAFQFQTDAQKIASYRKWLQGEIDKGILTVDGVGEPWTNPYIQAPYRKGFARSYDEVNKLSKSEFERQQFLQTAFNQPVLQSKVELLYTRTYEGLKDITTSMGQQMSRILADDITAGAGPKVIARHLRKNVEKMTNTRALLIARTEVIHAHAEGQLDSFEMLGVEEVDIFAEFSTAGDDLVCAQCAALEGEVFKIKDAHGIITVHPNCRCAWKPADIRQKAAPRVEPVKSFDDPIPLDTFGNPSKVFQHKISLLEMGTPKGVRQALNKKGYRINVGKRVSSVDPKLAKEEPRGWEKGSTMEMVDAYQNPNNKTVVIVEETINRNGEYAKVAVKVGKNRSTQAVHHEIGHAYENTLGDTPKSADLSEQFHAAYIKDRIFLDQTLKLNEVPYFTQPGIAGPQETFAQLYAERISSDARSEYQALGIWFPKSWSVMGDIVRAAKAVK